jgi:hypothetical protein
MWHFIHDAAMRNYARCANGSRKSQSERISDKPVVEPIAIPHRGGFNPNVTVGGLTMNAGAIAPLGGAITPQSTIENYAQAWNETDRFPWDISSKKS